MTDAADVSPGAVVVDRDDDPDEQNPAVVVNTPPVRSDEWDLGGRTVAEYPGNEPYDDGAPIVVVVFRAELDEWRPDYAGEEPIPVGDVARGPVMYYTFPAPRLEQVGQLGDDGDTADSTAADTTETATPQRAALEAIADALRDHRVADVRVVASRGTVEVDKLGVTYHVAPDGTVREQQGLAAQIERVAREAVADLEVTA